MMFGSCSLVFQVPNNSGPEIGAIWNAIQQVATETRVDHRFILAVMLQGMNPSPQANPQQSNTTPQNQAAASAPQPQQAASATQV